MKRARPASHSATCGEQANPWNGGTLFREEERLPAIHLTVRPPQETDCSSLVSAKSLRSRATNFTFLRRRLNNAG